MRYTPENITKLERGEVFVFGSNVEGRHGKGAAKFAMQNFGAKYGIGEGMTGRCYALPTVGRGIKKMPLSQIQEHVNKFISYAKVNEDLTFLVTKVGCGLAGYTAADIGPMFKEAPGNVVLPVEFETFI